MFLVRDIMYCKPGQVRAMVQKFLALEQARTADAAWATCAS